MLEECVTHIHDKFIWDEAFSRIRIHFLLCVRSGMTARIRLRGYFCLDG